MLYGHLPPLRAVVVVLAVLIGAYGLEPGALTTVLLLIMYATARYAAVTGLAWFRFTRRRMRGITPVKLLDDTRMLAFQRVTLRIFDCRTTRGGCGKPCDDGGSGARTASTSSR